MPTTRTTTTKIACLPIMALLASPLFLHSSSVADAAPERMLRRSRSPPPAPVVMAEENMYDDAFLKEVAGGGPLSSSSSSSSSATNQLEERPATHTATLMNASAETTTTARHQRVVDRDGGTVTGSGASAPEPPAASDASTTTAPKPPLSNECPQDITLLGTSGETAFPSGGSGRYDAPPAHIYSQDTSTVTVGLFQGFTRHSAVDSIHYQYRESIFGEKCYQETDVGSGKEYGRVTIRCSAMSPRAYVEICIADKLENGFLSRGDNATIPRCCGVSEDDEPDRGERTTPTPVVCYKLEIRCRTTCGDEPGSDRTSQRLLRGGTSAAR